MEDYFIRTNIDNLKMELLEAYKLGINEGNRGNNEYLC